LAMHYTPHVDLAFASVEHIMRDVNNGWFAIFMLMGLQCFLL
jgi:ubiquinol-cytochrome c reductase cytochrome b subunit